jgi:hypothetical protein
VTPLLRAVNVGVGPAADEEEGGEEEEEARLSAQACRAGRKPGALRLQLGLL